ncbi:MAG: PQQ-binding-like beta-propeller repeat protein, partial [Thermoguttaceae bacterium]
LKKGGQWTRTLKPTPQDVDAWTHSRYNASRNDVCRDRVVGPPNAVRWIGGLGSFTATSPRTSDGVFVQYCPVSFPGSRSGSFYLSARDVNSGLLLWKREVAPPLTSGYAYGWGEAFVGDILVAAGGRVYTYNLAGEGPEYALTAFNIRTGEVEKVFDQSVVIRKAPKERLPNEVRRALVRSTVAVEAGKVIQLYDKNLYVMDAASGKLLWKKEPGASGQYRYVVAGDGLLVALKGKSKEWEHEPEIVFMPEALEGYSLDDGRPLWTFKDFGPDIEIMCDMYGLSKGYLPISEVSSETGKRPRSFALLLDARKGTVVWKKQVDGLAFNHSRQLFSGRIVGNEIWYAHTTRAFSLDLASGERKGLLDNERHRGCSGSVVTPNYFVIQKVFHVLGNAAAQDGPPKYYFQRCFNSFCADKVTPSYGSVFNCGSMCPCEAYIPGSSMAFYAVPPVQVLPDGARLNKDFREKPLGPLPLPRQTAQQSAVATPECGNPDGLQFIVRRFVTETFTQGFGPGRGAAWTGYHRDMTDAVQKDDLSLAACVHEHRLAALRDGKEVWNFVAGGRISSEPVIHQDLAIFGSHDGYVYAVHAKDGSPAWRFLAAPADKRHVVFGQVESAWPVFNVVLHEGKAYFAAGRHSDLDGGIHIYCLDPTSGAVQWHVKYVRGLSTDQHTPYGGKKVGKTVELLASDLQIPEKLRGRKDLSPANSYALNDPIRVQGNKITVRGVYVVGGSKGGWKSEMKSYPPGEVVLVEDLANPKDTIVNPETLVPPGVF